MGTVEPDLAPQPSRPRPAWFAVGAAYLALAIAMTFPLVLHFRTGLPVGLDDVWQNYWNFWWWKKALLELHASPFFASTLFFPSGGDAVLHTHSPFNMLVALPVTLLLGPAAAYNFCVLLALTASGIGAYALTLELTGQRRAAFLAGLVFAFFPNTLEHTREHLNHFSTQFLPLSLLFFLRLRRDGRLRDAVGLGVCFAANALVDWHMGIALSLLLVVLTLVELARRAGRFGVLLAFSAVVATALLLPAAAPLFATIATARDGALAIRDLGRTEFGADIAFLWLPPAENPLLGFLTSRIYATSRRYPNAGFVCYLGYSALALAVVGAVRERRARPWLALFVGFLVLSIGATPFWLGRPIPGLVLPFRWVEQVPILNLAREANHFLVLVGLGLAVLAGFGWAALRSPPRWAFPVACGLILLECSILPYPIREIEILPYAQHLATGGPAGAVLDIPFSADGRLGQNMRYQVTHGRPIAGGYLSITPARATRALARDPLLSKLHGFVPRLEAPPAPADFARRGFGVVILHKNKVAGMQSIQRRRAGDLIPQAVYEKLRRDLEQGLGPAAYEDAAVVAFEIPGATAVLPTSAAEPTLTVPRRPSRARRLSRDRS